jgi:2-polyprenyl-6-methoxyphenol hydroxylase-like FAD-dependent oxidoreductase
MTNVINSQCCIAGGGPAGMMLGLLLARAGIRTTVLEKHSDFLRDFRGDTIHPSTLELIHELGLLGAFLDLPHHRAKYIGAQFGERHLRLADFTSLPVQCGFVAFMPQWDFLDFLAVQGRNYPGFDLRMQAEVTQTIEQNGVVQGVRAKTAAGELEVRADLVVAADGRASTVRSCSGLKVDVLGAPMDVLWFSLPLESGDPDESSGHFDAGGILITIRRREHWQCGFVITKGTADALREQGIEALREKIVELAPLFKPRIDTLRTWDDVKLLTVAVDRLSQWHRPGLLLIGDAAHAMSPIGGVGVNLAIQDAVASANLLWEPLRDGTMTEAVLAAVQRRRAWPTRVTQGLQLQVQNRFIKTVLAGSGQLAPPLPLRIISRVPMLQRLPARLIGLGVRPEHIRSPQT